MPIFLQPFSGTPWLHVPTPERRHLHIFNGRLRTLSFAFSGAVAADDANWSDVPALGTETMQFHDRAIGHVRGYDVLAFKTGTLDGYLGVPIIGTATYTYDTDPTPPPTSVRITLDAFTDASGLRARILAFRFLTNIYEQTFTSKGTDTAAHYFNLIPDTPSGTDPYDCTAASIAVTPAYASV